MLLDYDWPGNLDELAAAVERAHAAAGSPIGRDEMISAIHAGRPRADRESG